MKTILRQSLKTILVLAGLFGIVALVSAWTPPSTTPPGGNVSAPVNVGGSEQYKSGALGIGGVFKAYTDAIFSGSVKITGGSPGAGKVLTSDSAGLASWQTPSGSGGRPFLNEFRILSFSEIKSVNDSNASAIGNGILSCGGPCEATASLYYGSTRLTKTNAFCTINQNDMNSHKDDTGMGRCQVFLGSDGNWRIYIKRQNASGSMDCGTYCLAERF